MKKKITNQDYILKNHQKRNSNEECHYGIVFNINKPSIDLLPPDHRLCKPTLAQPSVFYDEIHVALTERGFKQLQSTMYSCVCSYKYALNTAHRLRHIDWFLFIVYRVHIVKIITNESLFIPVQEDSEREDQLDYDYTDDDNEENYNFNNNGIGSNYSGSSFKNIKKVIDNGLSKKKEIKKVSKKMNANQTQCRMDNEETDISDN